MNKLYKIATTLLLCATVVGCSSDDDATIHYDFEAGDKIAGYVRENNGSPIEGVIVSDGYSCTTTDSKGAYELTACDYSYQVYITLPAEYEVPIKDGAPYFWRQLSETSNYNFTLTPLKGGKESAFNLYCFADPQCQNTTHLGRFQSETVPDVQESLKGATLPNYGITVGDVIYNTANTNVTATMMPRMKVAMSEGNLGLPVFQVMGNHDYTVMTCDGSDAGDISAQRNFEYKFGPINYAFERGDVLVIAMDNIIFTNHDNYSGGFRDDQVEWLTSLLEKVEKDKLVIFCAHLPFCNNLTKRNVQTVLNKLTAFNNEVRILSGHTHYAKNYLHNVGGKEIYENVFGAVCGAWWNSTINTDGTPNGYSILNINNNVLENLRFKSTGFDMGFQIRLYRASDKFNGYGFAKTASTAIYTNIWNSDNVDNWTVKVYEDGTYKGEMSRENAVDAWNKGYHLGILGKASNYYRTTDHMYYFDGVQSSGTTIKIVATDQFGNEFAQEEFTGTGSEYYPTI